MTGLSPRARLRRRAVALEMRGVHAPECDRHTGPGCVIACVGKGVASGSTTPAIARRALRSRGRPSPDDRSGDRGTGRCRREAVARRLPPGTTDPACASPGRSSRPPAAARQLRPWQRHKAAGAAARTKAVVARQDAHAWLRGDRATAPSSLDRRPEQARARSGVGSHRTDDRRDPDHGAVASPRGAVISSARARALLRFVQLISEPNAGERSCSHIAKRLRHPNVLGLLGLLTGASQFGVGRDVRIDRSVTKKAASSRRDESLAFSRRPGQCVRDLWRPGCPRSAWSRTSETCSASWNSPPGSST